jgi:hypothetical protein
MSPSFQVCSPGTFVRAARKLQQTAPHDECSIASKRLAKFLLWAPPLIPPVMGLALLIRADAVASGVLT